MKNQSIVARSRAQRRCSFRLGPAPKGLTAPDFRYFESPIGEARFASTRRLGLTVPAENGSVRRQKLPCITAVTGVSSPSRELPWDKSQFCSRPTATGAWRRSLGSRHRSVPRWGATNVVEGGQQFRRVNHSAFRRNMNLNFMHPAPE